MWQDRQQLEQAAKRLAGKYVAEHATITVAFTDPFVAYTTAEAIVHGVRVVQVARHEKHEDQWFCLSHDVTAGPVQPADATRD